MLGVAKGPVDVNLERLEPIGAEQRFNLRPRGEGVRVSLLLNGRQLDRKCRHGSTLGTRLPRLGPVSGDKSLFAGDILAILLFEFQRDLKDRGALPLLQSCLPHKILARRAGVQPRRLALRRALRRKCDVAEQEAV